MQSLRGILLALICALPMAAQAEVTLRLATPDDPISNPIEDIEITASAIDAAVGTNFFSTQADALVADLAVLRADLDIAVRNQILSDPRTISVLALTVTTDPISVRLTQDTGAIGLKVAGIHVNYTIKADVPFPKSLICPKVTFTADSDFSGTGTFNYITGVLGSINIVDDVNVTGANCSGITSFIGNFLDAIFGVFNGFIESSIESNLRAKLDFELIQTMFSLTDLTQDLAQAIPPGAVKDKVLEVVDHFIALLSVNRGLQLDISLDPDFYGPTGPLLSLTASQQEPSISADLIQGETIFSVDAPGANQYDIYAQGFFLISTTSNTVIGGYQNPGDQILAVAHSALIPGLKSFPRQTIVQEPLAGCGPTGPICFP